MSSYVQKVLLPNERVLYGASLHWIIYVQGLMITIVGGVIGFFSYDIVALMFGQGFAQQAGRPLAGIALLVVLLGVCFLIGAYLRQISTELVLTNRRLIAKYGIISRATFEIMAARITGANFDQTISGRLLGYGTILVHGAGGEVSPIDLVADPQSFQRALIAMVQSGQTGG